MTKPRSNQSLEPAIAVHAPAIAPFAIPWRGDARLALPHGALEFVPCSVDGAAQAALDRLDMESLVVLPDGSFVVTNEGHTDRDGIADALAAITATLRQEA